MHLGALIAGADTTLLNALSAYALPIGEAFQLRDDLLGVFGDPHSTGNPVLDDLREGKRAILTETGAVAQVEHLIGRQHATALTALGTAPISTEAKEALATLAHTMIYRER